MATSEVKLLKSVDRPQKSVTIAPLADRDFWMTFRHSLLQQLAIIEKKLGISRRCKHCGNDL